MIRWLSDHVKTPKPLNTNSKEEVAKLKKEIEALQEEVKDLEQKTGCTEKQGDGDPEEEEEKEEDDDEDCPDDMPPPPGYASKGPRASVSAEAYGAWNKQKEYPPVVHAKPP